MITLFSVPKPFRDPHISTIQRNAIRSWVLLDPSCEIILFGNEEGVAEFAKELGVRHFPDIVCNEFGTPLVNDVFLKAQNLANHDLICYVNADIILTSDFMNAVKMLKDFKNKRFLMVGQRWGIDLENSLAFRNGWEEELRRRVRREGMLFPEWFIDYFLFPTGLWKKIPPFALGRTIWDNWLLYSVRARRIPLIDATPMVMAIHQNHDYSHHEKGKKGIWEGVEAKRNECLADKKQRLAVSHANYLLKKNGVKRNLINIHRRLAIFKKLYTISALCPSLNGSVRFAQELLNRILPLPDYLKQTPKFAPKQLPTAKTALVICDVWDHHWHLESSQRIGQLARKINQFANALREKGVLIIHAPSDTMNYYKTHKSRTRISNISENYLFIKEKICIFEPVPLITSKKKTKFVWQKQNNEIDIDENKDVISDSGEEIVNFIKSKKINTLLYAGVHSNECLLNRSFGILTMKNNGVNAILIEDLVDCLPGGKKFGIDFWKEANQRMSEYYRKYICPVLSSIELWSRLINSK